jgi:hypothetical protein
MVSKAEVERMGGTSGDGPSRAAMASGIYAPSYLHLHQGVDHLQPVAANLESAKGSSGRDWRRGAV